MEFSLKLKDKEIDGIKKKTVPDHREADLDN